MSPTAPRFEPAAVEHSDDDVNGLCLLDRALALFTPPAAGATSAVVMSISMSFTHACESSIVSETIPAAG